MNPQASFGWPLIALAMVVILIARVRRARRLDIVGPRQRRTSLPVKVARVIGVVMWIGVAVWGWRNAGTLRGDDVLHRLDAAPATASLAASDRSQILFVVSDPSGLLPAEAVFERIVPRDADGARASCEEIGLSVRAFRGAGAAQGVDRVQFWSRGSFADEQVDANAQIALGDGRPYRVLCESIVSAPIGRALGLDRRRYLVRVLARPLVPDDRLVPAPAQDWVAAFDATEAARATRASADSLREDRADDPLLRLIRGPDSAGIGVLLVSLFLCTIGMSFPRSAAGITLGALVVLGFLARVDLNRASALIDSATPLERRAGAVALSRSSVLAATAAERLSDAFAHEVDRSVRATMVLAPFRGDSRLRDTAAARDLLRLAASDPDERVRAAAAEARRVLDQRDSR